MDMSLGDDGTAYPHAVAGRPRQTRSPASVVGVRQGDMESPLTLGSRPGKNRSPTDYDLPPWPTEHLTPVSWNHKPWVPACATR